MADSYDSVCYVMVTMKHMYACNDHFDREELIMFEYDCMVCTIHNCTCRAGSEGEGGGVG